MELTKRTSLETTTDVNETIEWKIDTLKEKSLPVPEGIADYVSFALQNLQGQLDQLKAVKAEIKDRESALKAQTERIKTGVAEWLTDNGLDKLEGNIVSSITINKPGEATVKQVFKTNLTKKEQEQLIIDAGFGYYETNEVEAKPASIRVNKRKPGTVTVDENPS